MKLQRTWVLLILLLLVVPAPMSSAEPDNGEEAAINAIKKMGGRVEFGNNVVIFVNLRDKTVSDAGLEHLKALKSLRELYLSNTNVSNAKLEHLKGLKSLRQLYLFNTNVSDAGLVHLKGLKSLRTLYLSDTNVSDAGLEHLKGLTNLSQLYLTNTYVSDAGMKHLKGMKSLEYLDLRRTRVTDAGREHLLKGLTNLVVEGSVAAEPQDLIKPEPESQRAVAALKPFERSLIMSVGLDPRDGYNIYMGDPQITDTKLAFMIVHIKRLRPIAGLTLHGTAVTAEGLKQLRELPEAKSLWIEDADIVADGLAHLKEVPGLEGLTLLRTDATDASLVHLKGMKNLTSLTISSRLVTDAGLEHIGGLTNLTALDLAITEVTDAGVAKLKRLTKLKRLYLGYSKITDRGLVHLKRMTKLTYVGVTSGQITDAGLVHLVGLKDLEHLVLAGNKITDRAVAQLSQMRKLRWLDLNHTQMTQEGIRELKRALPNARIQFPLARGKAPVRPPAVLYRFKRAPGEFGPEQAPAVEGAIVVEGEPVIVRGRGLTPAVAAAFKSFDEREAYLWAKVKKSRKKLLDELQAAKQAATKAGDGDVAEAIQVQIDREQQIESILSENPTIEASRKRLIGTVWKGYGGQFTIQDGGQLVLSTGGKKRWAFVGPYRIIVSDGEISADIIEFMPSMDEYSFQRVGRDAIKFMSRANTERPQVAKTQEPVNGQEAAIAAIKKLGGSVFSTSNTFRLGDKVYSGNGTNVQLIRTKVTDADLKHLKWLKSLQQVDLSITKVSDAGLEHLKGRKSLLWLTAKKVSHWYGRRFLIFA